MASKHNIFIEQGSTFHLYLTWKDPNETPIDLTGFRIRMQVRQEPESAATLLDFDSDALELPSDNYLARAGRKGALRFPVDTLLFHLTRMSHMGLSCVSCGACEDACPMDIPIAQIFTLVGSDAQELFGHSPGAERGTPSPLVAYRDEEFHEIEMPYVETLKAKGKGE